MTSAPNNNQQNLRQQSMTSVGPDSRYSMSSPPPNYYQRDLAEKDQIKESFFKRLFFQWDMRMIEAELQRLKLSKSDLIGSSFQKSELGFFNLFFQMIPTLNICLFALFAAIVIYIITAQFSIVFAVIITILFMQITIFNNAKIIYRLDAHKIGEKATGRFIKIVRSVWHVFESFYIMLTLMLFLLYIAPVNWKKVGIKIANIHFQTPVYELVWKHFSSFLNLQKLGNSFNNFISGFLIVFLLFMLLYILGSYITYSKSKKAQKTQIFQTKKETLNAADLAREVLDF